MKRKERKALLIAMREESKKQLETMKKQLETMEKSNEELGIK